MDGKWSGLWLFLLALLGFACERRRFLLLLAVLGAICWGAIEAFGVAAGAAR